jgi:hypothetical protein
MIQVLVFSNVVNVMAAYQPVCKCAVHASSTVYRTLANRLVCRHDIDHVTKDEHLNHNCSFTKARNSSLMMVPA